MDAPDQFKTWSAICAIAGALERKVWMRSQRDDIYPNLYVFLVGGPGSGKTRSMMACHSLWAAALKKHHIAPINLTKAALMDRLGRATRIFEPPMTGVFNSLLIASPEMGALLPSYDSDFMNALTHIYDNLKYDEERRGRAEPLIIENPQINLLACTTPAYLFDTMPSGAWDQGFLSRVIIIYSDIKDADPAPLNLLGEERSKHNSKLYKALIEDLTEIGKRQGRIAVTADAATLIERWHMSQKDTAPTHPRLFHYTRRRTVHLLKLCMIAACDRGAANIDVPDFQAAADWLAQAEYTMGDIFTVMRSGGDAAVIADCWHYVMTMSVRYPNGLTDAQIWEYLNGRVPSYAIPKIVEVMVKAQILKVYAQDNRLYYRAGKRL